MKDKKRWKDQTQKERLLLIFKFAVIAVLTAGTIVIYVFAGKIFGEDSVFNKSLGDNVTLNTLYQKIPALLKSIQIIVIAYILSFLIRWILQKGLARSQRGITIVKLLDSFIKYLIAIIALLTVLGAWGVDTGTLLASAGILGLVVGLGAQSLIADIIAGVFIVFEGEYQVGDIVVIDGWRGTVDEIGIRTTKIIDAGGNVKIVNNSDIRSIINQTQQLSLATCEVGIEYGESLERVETVIRDNLAPLRDKITAIVDGPYYKGVKTLNASSVDLLFVARCKEEDLFQVQRDLNREIKLIFDKNEINIPFAQVVVNSPAEFAAKANKKTALGAQAFVEEQKELSKDLEEKVQ